jgi:ribosomal protein S18 acetylase RimI-like enzyme
VRQKGKVLGVALSPDGPRRRGIGTALVKHVEVELARRGCPKINLQVHLSNAATVEFYRKLGYHIEERISMGKVVGPR